MQDLQYSDISDDEVVKGSEEDVKCPECSRRPCVMVSTQRRIAGMFTTASQLGLPDSGKREFCTDYIGMVMDGKLPACITNLIMKTFPEEGD